MKEHFQDYGVRRWAGDDLIELQGEPLEALQRLVEPYAPCIIQGCGINTAENRIEPGLVALWLLDGEKKRQCVKIARFGGCPTTNLPVYLTLTCSQETRVYADGESKVVANSYTAQESILWEEVKDMYPLTITETGGTRLPENISVNFGPATERENIESGERLPILFGKIRKWLRDLGTLAFKDEVTETDLETTLGNKLNVQADWNEKNTDNRAFIKNKPTANNIGGTLPVANGGTGQTTAAAAAGALLNGLGASVTVPADNDKIIISTNGIDTYVRKPLGLLCEWIKSKLATVATSGSYNDLTNKPTASTIGALPLSGGIMTGPIKHSISESTTDPYYISAGGGVGKNAGKYGLKLLSHDGNGQSGIGVDLTGYSYEMTIAASCSSSGTTHITFAKHTNTSTTYTRLAEIDGSGNFNAIGQIKENGQRVYSPNNKPPQATTSADGLMSASDKSKLNGIAAGAQVNPAYATASINSTVPTNTDGYYQTGACNSGSYMNLVGSSNTVARGDHKHSLFIANATTSKPGLMSKTDKTNLDLFAGTPKVIYACSFGVKDGNVSKGQENAIPGVSVSLVYFNNTSGKYVQVTTKQSLYTYIIPIVTGQSAAPAFFDGNSGSGSFRIRLRHGTTEVTEIGGASLVLIGI